MPKTNITVMTEVTISEDTVMKVFMSALEDMTERSKILDGRLYRDGYDLGPSEAPKFAITVAACRLHDLLRAKR